MKRDNEYAVVMENINKTFPGVKALDSVTFRLKRVKSTLSWAKTVQASPR